MSVSSSVYKSLFAVSVAGAIVALAQTSASADPIPLRPTPPLVIKTTFDCAYEPTPATAHVALKTGKLVGTDLVKVTIKGPNGPFYANTCGDQFVDGKVNAHPVGGTPPTNDKDWIYTCSAVLDGKCATITPHK